MHFQDAVDDSVVALTNLAMQPCHHPVHTVLLLHVHT